MNVDIDKKLTELSGSLSLCKSAKEFEMFLRDLLTDSEIKELSNRWKVAQMLSKKTPYLEIEKETGMSSTTIARINKWLQKGAGGYKMMLERASKK